MLLGPCLFSRWPAALHDAHSNLVQGKTRTVNTCEIYTLIKDAYLELVGELYFQTKLGED